MAGRKPLSTGRSNARAIRFYFVLIGSCLPGVDLSRIASVIADTPCPIGKIRTQWHLTAYPGLPLPPMGSANTSMQPICSFQDDELIGRATLVRD